MLWCSQDKVEMHEVTSDQARSVARSWEHREREREKVVVRGGDTLGAHRAVLSFSLDLTGAS